ncbi:hypothetical protein I3842_14G034200 [Carya illinoinensis]|uniref:Uncharacterized protein n=1 Tax=Carya illinoinensis TaxID=32201 RepID=A0A922AEX4_CARIL|nr:hypothetical protein I3842_14G034200 [Carya illinoinensis]
MEYPILSRTQEIISLSRRSSPSQTRTLSPSLLESPLLSLSHPFSPSALSCADQNRSQSPSPFHPRAAGPIRSQSPSPFHPRAVWKWCFDPKPYENGEPREENIHDVGVMNSQCSGVMEAHGAARVTPAKGHELGEWVEDRKWGRKN